MLVLTRRRTEVILIGDDIEVMIVEAKGDKVRLGIKAPDSVKVLRKEVQDRIDREGEQSE